MSEIVILRYAWEASHYTVFGYSKDRVYTPVSYHYVGVCKALFGEAI